MPGARTPSSLLTSTVIGRFAAGAELGGALAWEREVEDAGAGELLIVDGGAGGELAFDPLLAQPANRPAVSTAAVRYRGLATGAQ